MKVNLKGLDAEEMKAFVRGLGLPDYKASQIFHRIYSKDAASIGEITELSKAHRAAIDKTAYISSSELIKRLKDKDGTEKLLLRFEDGEAVESVIIRDEDRLTLCVSSQAGCAMGCRFCLTGKGGLRRNLRAHEIIEQYTMAERIVRPERVANIVFMGMGEPMRNLPEVIKALRLMTTSLGVSARRITVSTSGVLDKMAEFQRTAPQVNLAVSLNATTDALRDFLMPVNKKYPIERLIEACRKYAVKKRGRITFEYVLMDGVNDSDADAKRLLRLLRGIPSKANLIPLNEFEGCEFKKPSEEKTLAFQRILMEGGLTALIRKSKGQGICAACGQLRRQTA